MFFCYTIILLLLINIIVARMNFHPNWLSLIEKIISILLFVILLFFIYRKRFLGKYPPTLLIGTTLWLTLLPALKAQMGAGHLAGLSYHLLGLNLACLVLGGRTTLALGCVSLLAYGTSNYGLDYLAVFPANALCLIFPTCILNAGLRNFAAPRLPKQLFIYIFLYGFLSSALGMVISGLMITTLLDMNHILATSQVWAAAFPIFFLLAWGEAFLSGLLTAIFVAFQPQWLTTFNDAYYLQRKKTIWHD